MLIFGFQKGKIDIKLPKSDYALGEVIEGSVELSLKKSFNAKELSITMIGNMKTSGTVGGTTFIGNMSIGRTAKKSESDYARIFNFKQTIDGEKEYASGQPLIYSFEINIPDSISIDKMAEQKAPGGDLGMAMKFNPQKISNEKRVISWYLIARLEVSGFDITKKIKVNIA